MLRNEGAKKKKKANRLAEENGRERARYAVGSQLFIFISMHGKSWQPSCAATAITPPALSSTLLPSLSSFSTGLPSPLVASSPAINTKNSQGQTAPPRFIAYEFSDLSIAATCLYPVTADPHLPSRASVSSPVRSRGSRSGATYFPGTNAMNQTACPRHECFSADIRSECSVPAIRDFSISCIFAPWFRYRRKERFFSSKTIELYLLFETDGARYDVERKRRDAIP